MKKNWIRIYNDRRDRYGITILSSKRALRIYTRERENPVVSLIEKGLLDELSQLKFMQSLTHKKNSNLPFSILAQKRIYPIIMPSEWCSLMHVEAAELVLRAEFFLAGHGFTLDDVHPWNILFDGASPYLVDIGAINFRGTDLHWGKEMSGFWPAYSSFKALSINPIFLFAAGRSLFARKMLQDYFSFSNLETFFLLIRKPWFCLLFLLNYCIASLLNGISSIATIFEKWCLSSNTYLMSRFTSRIGKFYFKIELCFLGNIRKSIIKKNKINKEISTEMNLALREIYHFLIQKQFSTIVCYASSCKVFESIRNNTDSWITFISPSEDVANYIYSRKYKNTSVLVLDLRSPTPGVGPLNSWLPAALERISSDVGIFILDMNELIFEKCMTVKEVFKTIEKLFKENAIVCLSNLMEQPRLMARNYGQLEKDNIRLTLEEVFVVIELVEVTPNVTTCLILKK